MFCVFLKEIICVINFDGIIIPLEFGTSMSEGRLKILIMIVGLDGMLYRIVYLHYEILEIHWSVNIITHIYIYIYIYMYIIYFLLLCKLQMRS